MYLQQELYWTHHWQKNITIPEIKSNDKDRWANQDKFPEDELSDTSSRDYPELYLESEYGQRTDREADFETEQVRYFHNIMDHLKVATILFPLWCVPGSLANHREKTKWSGLQ